MENCARSEQSRGDMVWALSARSCLVWWRGPKRRIASLMGVSKSIITSSEGSSDLQDGKAEGSMANQAAIRTRSGAFGLWLTFTATLERTHLRDTCRLSENLGDRDRTQAQQTLGSTGAL